MYIYRYDGATSLGRRPLSCSCTSKQTCVRVAPLREVLSPAPEEAAVGVGWEGAVVGGFAKVPSWSGRWFRQKFA